MSQQLDREGIFKVQPVSWRVKTFEGKKSVAIAIEFVVAAQLNETNEWEDWSGYAEVRVWGDYFVVKKDGSPNIGTCEQLAESIGWNGSLNRVTSGPPPSDLVQVAVKAEDYQGKTYFKAGWMNPGDYVPSPGGASEDEVALLDAQFGSLLRAATSGKRPPAVKQVKAPPPPKAYEPVNPADIPF